MFSVPENFRNRTHPTLKSDNTYGNNGLFIIPHERVQNYEYRIIASDGFGWEHVSLTVAERNKKAKRSPTWGEMCYIKAKFWGKDDTVLQYHPQESEYINRHPFCLHLWRPTNQEIPLPPKEFVG